ncbi:protein-tyrosine phosphatase-like protein [Neocallimastix lanati (nom. inval.)]|jgi:protein tyrosine phosphatase type 4A|nr:protein-tyrosine phosphatase-like protein [Neocallimastix sp. JGI-2020a]
MSQASYKMTGIPLSKILSFISYKNMNFLILDCPTDNTLPQYLREFKRNRVSDIVRVCEPTYSTMLLSENNITVHDWQFRDGAVPPANIVNNWLDLVEKKFGPLQQIRKEQSGNEEMNTENPTIAVHCVAGLGRAPVLVAIALIEAGMKPLQAVEHIRRYRRGAFNTNQLDFLDKYKRGQFSKKSSMFSLIKSKKERRSTESLKKGATNKSKSSGETHHSTKIFSFNKLFKSKTKSSQEVGVVN